MSARTPDGIDVDMRGTSPCPICGSPVMPHPNGGRRKRFCSRSCQLRSRFVTFASDEEIGPMFSQPANVGFRIDRGDLDEIKAAALRSGVSASEWMRRRLLEAVYADDDWASA